MKWLEVIKLRLAGKESGFLKEILLSVGRIHQCGLLETRIYHHAALESDLSIHLYWDTQGPDRNGSGHGLHLAWELKEFGLIDHTLWIEGEK